MLKQGQKQCVNIQRTPNETQSFSFSLSKSASKREREREREKTVCLFVWVSMPMAELTQPEVYSPRSLQLWRTLLNWLAFFFQIFAQILRALGHQPLLSSSSSTTHAFKPLPVAELPEQDSPTAVEIPAAATVSVSDSDHSSEKLTVRSC